MGFDAITVEAAPPAAVEGVATSTSSAGSTTRRVGGFFWAQQMPTSMTEETSAMLEIRGKIESVAVNTEGFGGDSAAVRNRGGNSVDEATYEQQITMLAMNQYGRTTWYAGVIVAAHNNRRHAMRSNYSKT